MRIIGGKYRSILLNTPDNYDIRPTTDRCKEALFSIIGYDIIDADVLDLFTGTGSIGVEALSRECKSVVFVDSSKESIKIVKSNLAKINDTGEVVLQNCENYIKSTTSKFDIIFLDPPYAEYKDKIDNLIKLIFENGLLKKDGFIVIELDVKNELFFDQFETYKFKKYGKTSFTFLRLKC